MWRLTIAQICPLCHRVHAHECDMSNLFFFRHLKKQNEKTGLRGFRPGPTRFGLYTNTEKGLKLEEEKFYYPSSENKGADQLCSYWFNHDTTHLGIDKVAI